MRRSKILGGALVLVAIGLLTWVVVGLLPTCAAYGIAPDERTCGASHPAIVFLILPALLSVGAALRILSTPSSEG